MAWNEKKSPMDIEGQGGGERIHHWQNLKRVRHRQTLTSALGKRQRMAPELCLFLDAQFDSNLMEISVFPSLISFSVPSITIYLHHLPNLFLHPRLLSSGSPNRLCGNRKGKNCCIKLIALNNKKSIKSIKFMASAVVDVEATCGINIFTGASL